MRPGRAAGGGAGGRRRGSANPSFAHPSWVGANLKPGKIVEAALVLLGLRAALLKYLTLCDQPCRNP